MQYCSHGWDKYKCRQWKHSDRKDVRKVKSWRWCCTRYRRCLRKNVCTIGDLVLRPCPWEHQAVVLHTISPISMKLCQFKGSTPKLKKTNWFLFDSSKYLTTLRSNISPCQKATALILIPLYNLSFHLWKSSKKSLGTTVFLSWMPFKICDCDKFLSGHLTK